MRPLIAKVMPATERGMGSKRWSNIRSALNCLAQRVGRVRSFGRGQRRFQSWEWEELTRQLDDSPQKSILGAFAAFCDERGILPIAVGSGTVEEYRNWREVWTYDTNINLNIGALRRFWNSRARADGDWPSTILSPPINLRTYRAPREQFAPSFLDEVSRYTKDLAAPDPMAELTRKPLSAASIGGFEQGLLWAATAVAKAGTPLTDITSLADLVTARNLETALRARHALHQKWTGTSYVMASAFSDVARRWLQLPQEEIDGIQRLRSRIKLKSTSLSPKVRARVRPFLDDETLLEKFFALPATLAQQAEDDRKQGRLKQAFSLHERATALQLLIRHPIRRRSLGSLRIDRHLQRDDKGRLTHFSIPPELSKTGVEINGEFSRQTATMLRRHLEVFRPLSIYPSGSPYLFPSEDPERPRHQQTVARMVAKSVEKALGVPFNIHMVRHIAAGVLLEEDPEAIHLAARLLGHNGTKTTANMYGHLRTRKADATYGELVDRRIARERRAGRRKNGQGGSR